MRRSLSGVQPLPPQQALPPTAQPPTGRSRPQLRTGRRRLLSWYPGLLWVAWRGCDQGGFYSTGVSGTHGEGCQSIYQPAAAAEQRFAEKQRQAAAAPAVSAVPAEADAESRLASAAAAPSRPAAETPQEERATLRKEQAAYERAVMEAERAERTRAFADSMWQSLE
ncbi:hypothetical protein ABPG77_004176 [Micractinium sp. CCAP 211/92]